MSGSSESVEVHRLPRRWYPSRLTPRLPIGAAIIAVGIALSGLLVLIAGTLVVAGAYFPASLAGVQLVNVSAVTGALFVILGAVLLVLGTALWRQEAWALYTTVVLIFGGLAFLFFTDTITLIFVLLLVVFVYLLAVQHYFY